MLMKIADQLQVARRSGATERVVMAHRFSLARSQIEAESERTFMISHDAEAL